MGALSKVLSAGAKALAKKRTKQAEQKLKDKFIRAHNGWRMAEKDGVEGKELADLKSSYLKAKKEWNNVKGDK